MTRKKKRKRKSPFRHKVSSHTRRSPKGKTVKVTEYWRGKGKKPLRKLARRKKHLTKNVSFKTRIKYVDGTEETLTVLAQTFPDALDAGLMHRTKIKPPATVVLERGRVKNKHGK